MPPEIPGSRAATERQWARPESAGSWNGGEGGGACQFKWPTTFSATCIRSGGCKTARGSPRLDAPKTSSEMVVSSSSTSSPSPSRSRSPNPSASFNRHQLTSGRPLAALCWCRAKPTDCSRSKHTTCDLVRWRTEKQSGKSTA